MKTVLFLLALLIGGCSILVPVKPPQWPEAPPELVEKCKNLQSIDAKDSVAITEMLKVIVNNYTLYYQCSNKVDGWNDWYTQQKKIYEQLR